MLLTVDLQLDRVLDGGVPQPRVVDDAAELLAVVGDPRDEDHGGGVVAGGGPRAAQRGR